MERRLLALRSVSVMTAPTRSRGFPMGTGSAAPGCTSQEKLSFRFTQFAHEGSVCVHARERFGLVVAKKLNRRKKTSCVRGKGVSALGAARVPARPPPGRGLSPRRGSSRRRAGAGPAPAQRAGVLPSDPVRRGPH